jgi:hypothetical protein
LLETGVARVDRIDVTDLGMEVQTYSAAEGWREITDRLPPMIEEGVEFNVAASKRQSASGIRRRRSCARPGS